MPEHTVCGYSVGAEGEMRSRDGSFGPLKIPKCTSHLGLGLVVLALGKGPQQAARDFLSGIQKGVAEYKFIGLLTGIRLENEIEVRPGINLVPLPNSTRDLPPIFRKFRYLDPEEFLNGTIIVVNCTVSPVYADPESPVMPRDLFQRGQECTDLPDFDVGVFSDALSLTSDGAIEWVCLWRSINPDEAFVVHGEHLGGHIIDNYALRERSSVLVNASQVQEAVSLYKTMRSLDDGASQKLQVPIRRWIKSKTQQPLVDSFIDLGIALESLYHDPGGGDQQSFRLRLRTALFLRENINDRQAVVKDVNRIYHLRSKAVHEGTVGEDQANKDYKEKAEELCRESIIRTIHHTQTTGQLPSSPSEKYQLRTNLVALEPEFS